MADILLFPAQRGLAMAHRLDAPPTAAERLVTTIDTDAWAEDDAGDTASLEMVESLAAAPSSSLAAVVTKMEVLVARLAPDQKVDTGLCMAEARLLRSLLGDLRAFAMDADFVAQGAGSWRSAAAPARFVQGHGLCSSPDSGVAHHQI